MADLKLSIQKSKTDDIKAKSKDLQDEIKIREAVWNKCNPEQKKNWIQKDPVLKAAWEQYQELHKIFGDLNG
jgi:hypothetical protein